jgi:phage gpG-like protein
MRPFFTAEEMADLLIKLKLTHRLFLHEGLKVVADKLVQTAKDEISQYQAEKGHFPEWAPLADSTIADKERLGYSPPDNPLLRTGEMRNSIKSNVVDLDIYFGCTDPKSVYHEFGTSKMPMRPFIGPAAFTNIEFIRKTIGKASAAGLKSGGSTINSAFKEKV